MAKTKKTGVEKAAFRKRHEISEGKKPVELDDSDSVLAELKLAMAGAKTAYSNAVIAYSRAVTAYSRAVTAHNNAVVAMQSNLKVILDVNDAFIEAGALDEVIEAGDLQLMLNLVKLASDKDAKAADVPMLLSLRENENVLVARSFIQELATQVRAVKSSFLEIGAKVNSESNRLGALEMAVDNILKN
ncbi:uncharacterized protein [Rutidosis leptorrhynchoides]